MEYMYSTSTSDISVFSGFKTKEAFFLHKFSTQSKRQSHKTDIILNMCSRFKIYFCQVVKVYERKGLGCLLREIWDRFCKNNFSNPLQRIFFLRNFAAKTNT
jgi:hypothetical protein